MLKQSPSRSPRSRGLKVKHVLKICLLLATGIWVLHQVKHLYGKNISQELQDGHETMKLGRKDLNPHIMGASLLVGGHGNGVEENKPEEIMDEGVGGGDDEIEGHDQERADEEESEEVEDLIDVDDRDRDEGSEERESEETDDEHEHEHASLLDDQAQNEGEKTAREAREDQDTQTISTIFQIGGLRMLKEEKADAEDINNSDPEFVGMNVVTEFLSSEHDVNNEENGNKIRLQRSGTAQNSSPSIEAMPIEDTNVELSPSSMQVKSLEASNGRSILQESFDNQDVSSDGKHITLRDVYSKQNKSFNEAVENEQPSSDIAAASASESVVARNGSSDFRKVELRNASTGRFRKTFIVKDD